MAIDTEDFLAHYGKKGMKWGVRTDDSGSSSSSGGSGKEVKLSRRQARALDKARKTEYDGQMATNVYMESKGKGERVLVKTRTPGDFADTIMTGKQFVEYTEAGNALDLGSTRIFARQSKAGEQFVLNNFEDEVYQPIKRVKRGLI